MHIMTVCLGNICRSPAAEAVLVCRLAEAGLSEVEVTSAGTADYHLGSPPHELSVAEGTSRGYAFSTVAAQFGVADFDRADLILVMDSANEQDVLALARGPQDAARVVRLGAFAPDAGSDVDDVGGHATEVRDVPDPYGHPRPAYARMYDQIEEAVDGLVAALAQGRLEAVVAAAVARRGG